MVRAAGKESESYGTLKEGARIPASSMFDDVYNPHSPSKSLISLS